MKGAGAGVPRSLTAIGAMCYLFASASRQGRKESSGDSIVNYPELDRLRALPAEHLAGSDGRVATDSDLQRSGPHSPSGAEAWRNAF